MTIRLLEELSPIEKLSLIDVSYSRLTMYDNCPAQYFYSYILQEKQRFGTHAALGSTVHSTLERWDWNEPFDLFELHRDYERCLDIHDPDHLIPDDLINVGYEIISDFVERHERDSFNVLGVEIPFAIVIGRGLVSGYIDRVDDEGEYLKLIDYKTGKVPIKIADTPKNMQTGIYALAMKTQYPDRKIKSELYYLRTGALRSHTYTDEDLAEMEETLMDKINTLIEGTNFAHTENPWNCRFCDHGISGLCYVGATRRKKLNF